MQALRATQEQTHFTYADYAKLKTKERYEVIDGGAYMMAAPSISQQRISREFTRQFANFLAGKTCEVFAAPVDVCLNALGDDDYDVLQPDLIIVCDRPKLDGKRCNGAPDMVIEIISPSSSRMDRFTKLSKYQKTGVREYWIVDSDLKTVHAFILENGKYFVTVYGDTDTAPVSVLAGCEINLAGVFAGIE